jgi:hypothetical protein
MSRPNDFLMPTANSTKSKNKSVVATADNAFSSLRSRSPVTAGWWPLNVLQKSMSESPTQNSSTDEDRNGKIHDKLTARCTQKAKRMTIVGVFLILFSAFQICNFLWEFVDFGLTPIASIILLFLGWWICARAAKLRASDRG